MDVGPVERGSSLLARMNSGDRQARDELESLFPELLKLAYAGRPDAQALAGGIWLEVMHDYPRALDLFEKAAAAGNPAGQRALGSMFGAGRGVAQDYKRAVELFEQAAEQGDSIALSISAGCTSTV